MSDLPWVAAAAANLAGWHDSSLLALGLRTRWTSALWTCPEPGPSIFHAAVTLGGPEAADEQSAGIEALADERAGVITLSETWSALDLGPLGFRPDHDHEAPWVARAPSRDPGPDDPPELRIEEVRTDASMAAFEAASIDAFDAPDLHALGRFGLHAKGILDDPAMRVFVGWVDDRVVSVSMAYVAFGMVGVYGVATLPGHRGHGYGWALTRRAVLEDPGLPAALQPSAEAASMYARMGFRPIGRATTWIRD